jgi:hypothetical protein
LKQLRTTPGIPAVVKVSRKKIGVIWGFLGVLGAVAFWQGAWWASLIFLGAMLSVAVLFYFGVSRESNVSVARGYVSVYPRTIGNETTAVSESTLKPEAIKEVGGAVLVFSRWSQLRIVFQNDMERASFISEVSGLLSANSV